MARLLLETGTNPNVQERSGYSHPLIAAQKGNVELILSLLFSGADLEAHSKRKEAPLSMAIMTGHHEGTELLNSGITRRYRESRSQR